MNASKSARGESRMYSRSGDGTPVAEVWAKADGTIVIEALASGAPIEIRTTGAVVLDSPDVRLTDEAGKALARVGDLVYVIAPLLQVVGAGPCVAVNPAQQGATGYIGAGQVVSGQPKATA
jgi:hypothetical protein